MQIKSTVISQSVGSVAINIINIINDVYEGIVLSNKAFDTIDHQILSHKLEFYGINGTPLKWIKSYLTNRKPYVKCNNIDLLLHDITQGVIYDQHTGISEKPPKALRADKCHGI